MASNDIVIKTIRAAMKQQGFTMRKLSDCTNIPYRTLQNNLNGVRGLSFGNFSKIANVLDISSVLDNDATDQTATIEPDIKMPDVGRVIDRMKLVLDIKTDVALADHLSVANQTVGAWRTRGSLPIEACIQIAQQKGVSLDYLILGNTDSLPTGGKIDADLFKECWKAACDHSDSIVGLRDLTVRTYNFCRGASDTATRVAVDDIAAILSSTDGST